MTTRRAHSSAAVVGSGCLRFRAAPPRYSDAVQRFSFLRLAAWVVALVVGAIYGAAGTVSHAYRVFGIPVGLVLAMVAGAAAPSLVPHGRAPPVCTPATVLTRTFSITAPPARAEPACASATDNIARCLHVSNAREQISAVQPGEQPGQNDCPVCPKE